MEFKFKAPFTCIISGPTQSGKTHFALHVLRNAARAIDPAPQKIIWCYGEYTRKLDELPCTVELVAGLPDIDDMNPEKHNLIVIDDLMAEAGNNKSIEALFTKGSHHKNMSVILIVQNLFHQSKSMRTISLNAQYMVLLKNPRDSGQIRYLGRQLFPGSVNFLNDAYKQATHKPHGYLVLDLTQSTEDQYRVLSDILPGEQGYYYVPKRN